MNIKSSELPRSVKTTDRVEIVEQVDEEDTGSDGCSEDTVGKDDNADMTIAGLFIKERPDEDEIVEEL